MLLRVLSSQRFRRHLRRHFAPDVVRELPAGVEECVEREGGIAIARQRDGADMALGRDSPSGGRPAISRC